MQSWATFIFDAIAGQTSHRCDCQCWVLLRATNVSAPNSFHGRELVMPADGVAFRERRHSAPVDWPIDYRSGRDCGLGRS